jgi:hypothetical protein
LTQNPGLCPKFNKLKKIFDKYEEKKYEKIILVQDLIFNNDKLTTNIKV